MIIGAGHPRPVDGLAPGPPAARHRGRATARTCWSLDKTGVAAGASGVACGVVRNNYFQPAMRELMAHSVGVWESDPEAFAYHRVGYMQIAPEAMRDDVVQIYAEQQAIGYASELVVEGGGVPRVHDGACSPTGRRPASPCVLHEKRGGYANNVASLKGLAAKAEAEGVRIRTGVRVTGLARGRRRGDGGADRPGRRRLRAPGGGGRPVDPGHLGDARPARADHRHRTATATVHPDRPMWTYWALQEGMLGVDPPSSSTTRAAAAGAARGLRRAALRRHRRRPGHRRDVGHLLQARLLLRRGSGRRVAVRGRPARRARSRRPVRAGEPGVRGRRGLRPDVDLGAGALPQAVRGQAARSTGASPPAGSARSPPTASPSSTRSGRTPTSSPTPTTATR